MAQKELAREEGRSRNTEGGRRGSGLLLIRRAHRRWTLRPWPGTPAEGFLKLPRTAGRVALAVSRPDAPRDEIANQSCWKRGGHYAPARRAARGDLATAKARLLPSGGPTRPQRRRLGQRPAGGTDDRRHKISGIREKYEDGAGRYKARGHNGEGGGARRDGDREAGRRRGDERQRGRGSRGAARDAGDLDRRPRTEPAELQQGAEDSATGAGRRRRREPGCRRPGRAPRARGFRAGDASSPSKGVAAFDGPLARTSEIGRSAAPLPRDPARKADGRAFADPR